MVHTLAPSPNGESLAMTKRLVVVADPVEHRDRPEYLLVVDAHLGREVGEHGRLVEEPGTVDAADRHRAPLPRDRARVVDLLLRFRRGPVAFASGPTSVAGSIGFSDVQAGHTGDERSLERVVDVGRGR